MPSASETAVTTASVASCSVAESGAVTSISMSLEPNPPPEAATVIQPLVQAMSFGQRAHDVARGQYWIHPALPEVVENALLDLPKPTG